jgi:TPR repeat protein
MKTGLLTRCFRIGFVTSTLAVVACGAAPAGEAVRPKDPTAAGALGEEGVPGSGSCKSVSSHARPFLADWKTDQRAELEAAMQGGIAVVHYDCDGIRVMPECTVPGAYRYARIPAAQEERIIEENSDVSATIPLSAVSIGADLSRGLKLKLKYALVGRKGAQKPEIIRNELPATCEEATHFVRAALVGAFELGTATEGSVGASAKVLGAGAEGSSKSARETTRSAGQLSACKSGDGDTQAPQNCENLVQLQLGPVVKIASRTDDDAPEEGEQAAQKTNEVENPCSVGFVLGADGACKKKSGAGAFLCDSKNVDECVSQCEKGSAQSCHNAGRAQYKKGVHANMEDARTAAVKFYEKGCSGKYLASCSALASSLSFGKGADKPRARSLFEQACSGGDAMACMSLASAAENGSLVEDRKNFTAQPTVAFQYTDKACSLGNSFACASLARRYIEGKGVMPSADKGLQQLQKQCGLGNSFTCIEWANYLMAGKSGIAANPEKALELYSSTCEKKNSAIACTSAGNLLRAGGKGVKKDKARATKYLEHACTNLNSSKACTVLGAMYESGEAGDKDAAKALSLYERACPPDKNFPNDGCYGAANLYEHGGKGVTKRTERVASTYTRACGSFDPEATGIPEKACRKAAAVLGTVNPNDSRRVLSTLCYSFKDKVSCDRLKKLPRPTGLGGPPGPPRPPPPPPKK